MDRFWDTPLRKSTTIIWSQLYHKVILWYAYENVYNYLKFWVINYSENFKTTLGSIFTLIQRRLFISKCQVQTDWFIGIKSRSRSSRSRSSKVLWPEAGHIWNFVVLSGNIYPLQVNFTLHWCIPNIFLPEIVYFIVSEGWYYRHGITHYLIHLEIIYNLCLSKK